MSHRRVALLVQGRWTFLIYILRTSPIVQPETWYYLGHLHRSESLSVVQQNLPDTITKHLSRPHGVPLLKITVVQAFFSPCQICNVCFKER